MFTLQDLRSDARYLALGDSTNTQYANTDLDRNINRWHEIGISLAMDANGDWEINGEIAVTSLVIGQREYILPADILRLNEVYIKSSVNSDYIKAKQRDLKGVQNYNEDYHPAVPEYDLLDNSLFIYIPDSSITAVPAGLKIVYQKDLVELLETSDAPNLPEPFKRLLSVGAAMDFCESNEMWTKAKKLSNRIYGDPTVKNDDGIKGELKKHFSNRSARNNAVLESIQENFY
jgi:hypothetical protein